MRILQSSFFALMALLFASHSESEISCASEFTVCAPTGATSETPPEIGTPAFEGLFEDIVLSSLPASRQRSLAVSQASLCCVASLSCLLMVNLEIPFCYDRFTTDYFLPDGSYGTVVSNFCSQFVDGALHGIVLLTPRLRAANF
jgi:hypothetical protein